MGIGIAMKLQSLRTKLFGNPHIPDVVIYLILLFIITQVATLLMNQPASYWQNPAYAEPYLALDFLLCYGPRLFGLGAICYLLAMAFLLKKLNNQTGLFLSSLLLFFHSFLFYRASAGGLLPVFEITTNIGSEIFRNGIPLIVIVLFFCSLLIKLPGRWTILARRAALVVSVSWVMLLGFGLIRAIRPPESPWHIITPVHSPGKRQYSAVAYDTKRQRAVMFGGVSEWKGSETIYDFSTWEWDGQDWHEMTPLVSPPGRIHHGMAYDEVRGEVLMYSGENGNGILTDLWAWDGEIWRLVCSGCKAEGRKWHEMFYDSENETVFIYGGYGNGEYGGYGEGGPVEEVWSWDGQHWTHFPVSTSLPKMINSPMVYDQANKRATAYISEPDWGGTWFLEGDTWRHFPLQVQPEYRFGPIMVYEPVHQKSIFFGGEFYGTWYKDTWVFDGDAWIELQTPFSPPHRSGSVAFYDPVRKSMILYGGQNEDMILKDMWEMTLPEGDL